MDVNDSNDSNGSKNSQDSQDSNKEEEHIRQDKPAKQIILEKFLKKHANLPGQRTQAWLDDRKFNIGGSEIGTVAGFNPYKGARELIEGHLGITSFRGNINTYWGTVLEDMVTKILEKLWDCKLYETGSLPGVIPGQKFSPDGLTYLSYIDKIVLVEIKSAARRVAGNSIPRQYKPQLYCGLDTVQIADFAIFVDAMFRRCSLENWDMTSKHCSVVHRPSKVDKPLALCFVGIYEKMYSEEYDDLIEDLDQPYIDAGACDLETLERLLKDAAETRLRFYLSETIMEDKTVNANTCQSTLDEFADFCTANGHHPVAVMPLKLFKLSLIPAYRDDWKTAFVDRKKVNKLVMTEASTTYVRHYEKDITDIINIVKRLDVLPRDEQLSEIDDLYPPPYAIEKTVEDDLIQSMLDCTIEDEEDLEKANLARQVQLVEDGKTRVPKPVKFSADEQDLIDSMM
jgi:hypothetical protein